MSYDAVFSVKNSWNLPLADSTYIFMDFGMEMLDTFAHVTERKGGGVNNSESQLSLLRKPARRLKTTLPA